MSYQGRYSQGWGGAVGHVAPRPVPSQACRASPHPSLLCTLCGLVCCGRWKQLSGQVLLERYGMTEIGMALSNPYEVRRYGGIRRYSHC